MSAIIFEWASSIILGILLVKGVESIFTVVGLILYLRRAYRIRNFEAEELLVGLATKGWSTQLKTLCKKVKNLKDWG